MPDPVALVELAWHAELVWREPVLPAGAHHRVPSAGVDPGDERTVGAAGALPRRRHLERCQAARVRDRFAWCDTGPADTDRDAAERLAAGVVGRPRPGAGER